MNDDELEAYHSYDRDRQSLRREQELKEAAYAKVISQFSDSMFADLMEQSYRYPGKFSNSDIQAIQKEAVLRLRKK